jgi:hypothetical protein
VDKHIRQLDEDLVRFEEEAAATFSRDAQSKFWGMENCSVAFVQAQSLDACGSLILFCRQCGERRGGIFAGRHGVRPCTLPSPDRGAPIFLSRTSLSSAQNRDTVDDMPVDPNEPTYCLCHQVGVSRFRR